MSSTNLEATDGPGSVSVVMGTFNGEHYVTEQLETVVGQTLSPDEIIVCDDGSTDGTLDLVESMRQSSEIPIRIVHNERRLGFSDNFLTGASLARSQYVAFCDQDDRWYPNKLETALGVMVQSEAVLSAHAVDLINSRGDVVSIHSQGIEETHVVEPLSGDPWSNYFGFTLVFRRDLLDVIPFSQRGESTYSFGAPLSHDRWLCALAHSLGRVVLISEPLAAYRQHDAQLFGVQAPRKSLGGFKLSAAQARERFGVLAREQVTLTRVCRQRSALFASAQPTLSVSRDQLDRASAFWSRLGDRHASRVDVHRAGPISARVRVLSAGLRQGLYARRNFGHRSFVKDLAMCAFSSSVGLRQKE